MDLQDVDLEQNWIFAKTACVRGQLKETKTKTGKRGKSRFNRKPEKPYSISKPIPGNSIKPFFMIPALAKPGKTINLSAKTFGFQH